MEFITNVRDQSSLFEVGWEGIKQIGLSCTSCQSCCPCCWTPEAVTEVGGSIVEPLYSVFKMINGQLLSNSYCGAEATMIIVINHTAKVARQILICTDIIL